jgi:hypothetical protein
VQRQNRELLILETQFRRSVSCLLLYTPEQLDELDRLTEAWVKDHERQAEAGRKGTHNQRARLLPVPRRVVTIATENYCILFVIIIFESEISGILYIGAGMFHIVLCVETEEVGG